ncbi:MAG: DUF4962 domain-containing protein [Bacteroidales bacterium]
MRKNILVVFCFYALTAAAKLTEPTLMHEIRETPSPLNGQQVMTSSPALMWPDKFPHLGPVLDGVEEEEHKPHVTYKVRLASNKEFTKDLMEADRNWAFFNPFQHLKPGKWYWQHAYVTPEGMEEWSPVYEFSIDKNARKMVAPSLDEVLKKLPTHHPRVLLDKSQWDEIIEKNKNNPEAGLFIKQANEALAIRLGHIDLEIDTSKLSILTNDVQRKSYRIRESRKIVDREEKNTEALVRAYLLTKDKKYYTGAMDRIREILSWKSSVNFAGDFNSSVLLAISTSAYDAFYDLLTKDEKTLLLNSIRENGNLFFEEFVNHLENRIADNHVWQMTFRILTMGAFATYGDLEEANTWVDYCYNMWVARFPGLNDDGGWHNGDSYFHVNVRTLIEVPAFYSRITGYDYFNDPWYNNNVNYVIYQQPPFSKSAGHGNAHEGQKKPNGVRVGYADALSRECQNPFAADYVKQILKKEKDVMNKTFLGKAGDLTWYRITTFKEPVQSELTLKNLPNAHIFPQTGLATMHSKLEETDNNAMFSFRSSPYGSTSHALADQNGFNTFFAGEPIFYGSGHRTGFTDDHCMYAYRNTRAHNAMLVNGMGQKIGTEGYGWIPQYYEGEQISYFVGDASNAYGEVTAPIWLKRGELSGTKFTPEKGWDKDRLKKYRRHVIQLGDSGLFAIYDEMEAIEPITFSYLLHTTEFPMEVKKEKNRIIVTGRNKKGYAHANLFCSENTSENMTDQFFAPAINWLNKTTADGKTIEYDNHWHFSATSDKATQTRFLTILDIHAKDGMAREVKRNGNHIEVEGWVIECNLTPVGNAAISVVAPAKSASLKYDAKNGDIRITDTVKGKKVSTKLEDEFPELEI